MVERMQRGRTLAYGLFFTGGGIYGIARGIYMAATGTLFQLENGEEISLSLGVVSLLIGLFFLDRFRHVPTAEHPKYWPTDRLASDAKPGQLAFCSRCGMPLANGAVRCSSCGQSTEEMKWV
jgi:hypothetical protein